jgi:hypothetical protein
MLSSVVEAVINTGTHHPPQHLLHEVAALLALTLTLTQLKPRLSSW